MFPYCNVSVSGLVPYAKYIIMVDMVLTDNSRYKVRRKKKQAMVNHCCKYKKKMLWRCQKTCRLAWITRLLWELYYMSKMLKKGKEKKVKTEITPKNHLRVQTVILLWSANHCKV